MTLPNICHASQCEKVTKTVINKQHLKVCRNIGVVHSLLPGIFEMFLWFVIFSNNYMIFQTIGQAKFCNNGYLASLPNLFALNDTLILLQWQPLLQGIENFYHLNFFLDSFTECAYIERNERRKYKYLVLCQKLMAVDLAQCKNYVWLDRCLQIRDFLYWFMCYNIEFFIEFRLNIFTWKIHQNFTWK